MTSRLYNNATYYCPLFDYTITKLVDATNGRSYPHGGYPSHTEMIMGNGGLLSLKKLNQPLSLFIFVNATNGKLFLHQELQPMALLEVTPAAIDPINHPPFFAGPLTDQITVIEDSEGEPETLVIQLPATMDANVNDTVTVSVENGLKSYMIWDEKTSSITINL